MRHSLIDAARYDALTTSDVITAAGRTKWEARGRLSRADSVTTPAVLVVESHAINAKVDDLGWSTVATVTLDTAGKEAVVGFTLAPGESYLRGRIARLPGDAPALVSLDTSAAFVDATDSDASLFSKELRGFADGFLRIVAHAEEVVLGELFTSKRAQAGLPTPYGITPIAGNVEPWLPSLVSVYTRGFAERSAGVPAAPELIARMDLPGFGDCVRAAVILQAEHLFRRHKLTQSDEPSAVVTLRDYPPLAPGLTRALDKYTNTAMSVWRGR